MIKQSLEHSRHHLWRLGLLLLVVVQFLPEIVIWLTAALAEIMGCQLDQKSACLIGSLPVSNIIALALVRARAGLIIAGIHTNDLWLVVLYVSVPLGSFCALLY